MTAVSDWFMCGRKKSYETQAKANKIGRKNNQRSYECPICHCWHLTKQLKIKGD